jgi:hypothetical protein
MVDSYSTIGLYGEISETAPSAPRRQPRRVERNPVQIGAGLRQRGASGVSVEILDLSTLGFRASTHLDLQIGADIWLKLPGLEAMHSRVAWTDGYLVGCQFERPLHPAVLQMVVRR